MAERTIEIGDRTVHLETGEIARQAGGSVVVREGDTVVLVAATTDPKPRDIGFLPLTVEYREAMAAAGRIPGNYFRREARAGEGETLTSRLIDRSIRPLFPRGYTCETQVIVTVLSYDPETDPGVLAIVGASTALMLSNIPWAGPVAAARIGRVGERWIAAAGPAALADSPIDLVVTTSGDGGLVMVEGEAKEFPEEEILAGFAFAESSLAAMQTAQRELAAEAGREKIAFESPTLGETVRSEAASWRVPLAEAMAETDRSRRAERRRAVFQEALSSHAQQHPGSDADPFRQALDAIVVEEVRRQIVEKGRRLDGRTTNEVRPIRSRVGWLPRAHGSSLFTRGETQAIVTVTLGSSQDSQEIESLDGKRRESFLLHYNFPSYSVGEVRPLRGPGRREIGHGALARRALRPVLPPPGKTPYTIRIDSRITESNGSSSMATVCGASLALMDAGVEITRPVAGVAMGLIADAESGRHIVLTDILGDEDHLGDMDFKVAGTEKGVTAIQLDNKLGRVPAEILAEGLRDAHAARLTILAAMAGTLEASRTEPSDHAPQIGSTWIQPQQIRVLIGPSGKTVQEIQQKTDSRIDIGNDGHVRVFSSQRDDLRKALERIEEVAGLPRVGEVYPGTVTGVKEFGCFVRIVGGNEGLLTAAEIGDRPTPMGATVAVKVLGVTERGRIRLAREDDPS